MAPRYTDPTKVAEYDPCLLSVLPHRPFQRLVANATPHNWSCKLNADSWYCQGSGKWRADVLSWRDDCYIALEAQRGDTCVERRTEAYLADGVVPLWIFLRIPGPMLEFPVFSVLDLPRVGKIMKTIKRLTFRKGMSWQEYCTALAPVAKFYRGPGLKLPRNRTGFDAGYRSGYRAGYKAGRARAEELLVIPVPPGKR